MAAQDLEKLVVSLSADIKKFENAMKRAQGVTNKQLGAIQKKATTSSKAIAASFARTGLQIAGAFASAQLLREVGALSDAATKIDNALKVAGLSGAELEKVYKRLNQAAIANGAPIETLAGLYGKAALAQKELGVTTEELLGFTNNVALALRVAGTDAQSASGALLQLGQALGSGKVQAEEFNSILEGAPTIAQAVAAGLKEAGGSVAKLKSLVVDGQISSEAFFRAFEAGAPILQQKVAGSVFTIEQATVNLKTALIDSVREFNNATGASQRFAGGVNNAAKAINDFDVAGLISKIQSADKAFRDYLSTIELFDELNKLTGTTDAEGNVINVDKEKAEDDVKALEREVELLQERIKLNTELGFDNVEAMARLDEVLGKLAQVRAAAAALPDFVEGYQVGPNGIEAVTGSTNGQMGGSKTRGGARRPVAVKPVSTSDFAPPPSKSSGGGGRGRGGGGRGANEYQREIEQIKERTLALQAETAAQGALNGKLIIFERAAA
ncbi:tape measure protein [Neorhizobium sp. Rsf11]|uniref:Tape measure protein n=1 Tax=Neorhizobium phenanthreniclasticum TaxID=3157917 RepID=A0ABV0M2R3_9HYPH